MQKITALIGRCSSLAPLLTEDQSDIAQLATPLFIASISQVVISTNADRSAHALRHRSHCPESAMLVNLQIVSAFRSPLRSMRSGTIDAVTDCTDANGGTIMRHQSRHKSTNPKTGHNTDARTSPLQPTIVKPEHAVPIKAFDLDLKVMLSTEATGGATSVLMMAQTR